MKDVAKLYLKENGIPHVRNFIDERRMKMVMTKCIDSRNDFLSYSKKRKADGTWTDDPDKQNDHAPDYVHYGSVYNWPQLAYQSFDADVPVETRPVDTDELTENDMSDIDEEISPTLTGGLMGKTF